LVFRSDGRIAGYRHFNECYWRIENDRLCLKNGQFTDTSIFEFSDFNEDHWPGSVVGVEDKFKHYLSLNKSHPIYVKHNSEIERIAERGEFYLEHFKKSHGVYNPSDTITVYPNAFIEPTAVLPRGSIFEMGAFSYFSGFAICNMRVGRYCSIANRVQLFERAHPMNWLTANPVAYTNHHFGLFSDIGIENPPGRLFFDETNAHVTTHIGNDVWIGADCLLKPGIRISDGAVVAARSIVTKDVPPFAVVGGAPARILKYRFDEKTIERLLKLNWWTLNLNNISFRWDDVDSALEAIEDALSQDDRRLTFKPVDYAVAILETEAFDL